MPSEDCAAAIVVRLRVGIELFVTFDHDHLREDLLLVVRIFCVSKAYLIPESYLLGHSVLLVLCLVRLTDHDVVTIAVHADATALASDATDEAALGLRTRGT